MLMDIGYNHQHITTQSLLEQRLYAEMVHIVSAEIEEELAPIMEALHDGCENKF